MKRIYTCKSAPGWSWRQFEDEALFDLYFLGNRVPGGFRGRFSEDRKMVVDSKKEAFVLANTPSKSLLLLSQIVVAEQPQFTTR